MFKFRLSHLPAYHFEHFSNFSLSSSIEWDKPFFMVVSLLHGTTYKASVLWLANCNIRENIKRLLYTTSKCWNIDLKTLMIMDPNLTVHKCSIDESIWHVKGITKFLQVSKVSGFWSSVRLIFSLKLILSMPHQFIFAAYQSPSLFYKWKMLLKQLISWEDRKKRKKKLAV